MKAFFVNLSMLGPSPTGLGVYSEHCAGCLERYFHCNIITSSYNPATDVTIIKSPKSIAIGNGGLASLKRILYSFTQFSRNTGFFYTPTHHGIFGQRNQIITIHDLIPIHHPGQHKLQHVYFKWMLPFFLRRCRAIFTVSESVKAEISEYYKLEKDKIFVIPCGVDSKVFCPCMEDDYPLESYLLAVGTQVPHKNVEELILNWNLWKGKFKLKIISSKSKYSLLLRSLVEELKLTEQVEFLGYVSRPDLVKLYQRCTALVFPSLCEGFGLPPLEVMGCGRPAIVSDIPVHKEILGDAAIYITPGNQKSWQKAFNLLTDKAQCATKITKGIELVKHYSWGRSCEMLIKALLTVEPKLEQYRRHLYD